MEKLEEKLRGEVLRVLGGKCNQPEDPAHDILHFERVVGLAKKISANEGGNLKVIIPAAWLHDYVAVPKNDPRRSQASRLSAQEALRFLREVDYDSSLFDQIAHAIEAHSFSAAIQCQTLDAQIVQDADRLDGLGAVGIARCFVTAGLLKRPLYNPNDPFCSNRSPDDSLYTIDHFYRKLFKVAEGLQTESGRQEGARRVQVMKEFISNLGRELPY